jgi:hypothetical protein
MTRATGVYPQAEESTTANFDSLCAKSESASSQEYVKDASKMVAYESSGHVPEVSGSGLGMRSEDDLLELVALELRRVIA